jgi:cell division protein FtsI/penicillin-binding protein 2
VPGAGARSASVDISHDPRSSPLPLPRRKVLIPAVAVAAVIALGVPAAVLVSLHLADERTRREQKAAADAFAAAWRAGHLAEAGFAGSSGQDVATQVQTMTAGLTTAATDAPASVTVGAIHRQKDAKPPTATATLNVSWRLPGGVVWTYPTRARLRQDGERWLVAWTPAVVHPGLTGGQVLQARRVQPPRGEILGAGDQVLVTQRPVVDVGIQPSRADDPAATARQVAAIVAVDPDALVKRVAAAKPDAFVDVITLRRDAYDAVRDRLRPIPGTVFNERDASLAPTATFARALLGSIGEATKEAVDAGMGRVLPGDQTGLSGLQNSYDERLAGTAGVTVSVVGGSTGGASGGTAGTAHTLFERPPQPGQPLHLTLDPRVQEAAEAALAAAPEPAGMVAIRVGTGDVLAVANGPEGAGGYDRALLGRYPPGSTFKVASTLALLTGGLSPDAPVNCPPTVTISGKTFSNAEGEVLGRVPFRLDFAHSCNTAFVGSAGRITSEQLADAAHSLGVGAADTLGVTAFMGDVPVTGDAVQHAAQVIGQGRVLVSPLTEATMAASVASGRLVPPRLVTDPAPQDASAPGQPLPAQPLARVVGQLRQMMRLVVTSGTGTALRGVPGGPVAGKTGTAEFGNGNPPATHAWFTGYQGDIAFAFVVEGGGFGGEVAAPLAADFLRRLAAG